MAKLVKSTQDIDVTLEKNLLVVYKVPQKEVDYLKSFPNVPFKGEFLVFDSFGFSHYFESEEKAEKFIETHK